MRRFVILGLVCLGLVHSASVWAVTYLPGYSTFVLGVNYPWYNGFSGLDVSTARSKDIAQDSRSVPDHGYHAFPVVRSQVNAGTNGFNATNIGLELDDMAAHGVKLVRWFLIWDWYSGYAVSGDGLTVTGFTAGTLTNLNTLVTMCEARGLKLLLVLLDFRIVQGAGRVYTDLSSEPPHPELITNATYRNALINDGIAVLVAQFAGRAGIYAYEVMNEVGNITCGTDSVTGWSIPANPSCSGEPNLVAVDTIQAFLNQAYTAIKTADPTARVLPSSVARPTQLPLIVGRVSADFYASHYHVEGTNVGAILSVATIQSTYLTPYGLTLNKALLAAEGPARLNNYMKEYYDDHVAGGWAGYLPWTYGELIDRFSFMQYAGATVTSDRPSIPMRWFSFWALGYVKRDIVGSRSLVASRQASSRSSVGARTTLGISRD